MAASVSLWVCPALAGEFQSIPALLRTMMDTFMPTIISLKSTFHISSSVDVALTNFLKLL